MNFRMIKHILGWLMLFEAVFLLVPTVTALIYRETVLAAFLWSVAACLSAGLLLLLGTPKDRTLHPRDGFLIVAFSWILMSLFGAMPLYLSRTIPSFIDALFETVSGFTTTGASILAEVENLPHAVLIWRSFTHWIGGMGVLVFIMAFLPLSGGQNMHIMRAESPGPSVSKLVPHVRTTAMLLYAIYICFTLAEFVLLLFDDMSAFEALNAAFATAGTGGFGFRNDSCASLTPYAQIVIAVFMMLFAINFNVYFLLWRRRWRDLFNTELCVFLVLVATATLTFFFNARAFFPSAGDAARGAFFTTTTIISSTGFSTVDFDLWPELSRVVIVLLMFVGACAGSTGGGIKVSRIVIFFKGMAREFHYAIHPRQVRKVSLDGRPVDDDTVRSVFTYMACFAMVFVCSMIAISFDNTDLVTSFTAVLATLNNIGPGLSLVGPTQNFAFFSTPSKCVLIFDMLAGRLELFPILLLFSPATWKK